MILPVIDNNFVLDRLLDALSMLLSGQPYKPLGAPTPLSRNDMSAIKEMNAAQVKRTWTLVILPTDIFSVDEWCRQESGADRTCSEHLGLL